MINAQGFTLDPSCESGGVFYFIFGLLFIIYSSAPSIELTD